MVHVKEHLNLLGTKVEDKISGYWGVVCAVRFDLYGGVQAAVNSNLDRDGKPKEQQWFDVSRLKPLSGKPAMKRPDFDFE